MQYENNRVDPARADELAREILYGCIPASEVLRTSGLLDGRTKAALNEQYRRVALGALQRGNARRILTTEEQENIQAGTQQANPKRTSGRTSF